MSKDKGPGHVSTGEIPLYGAMARDLAKALLRKMPHDADALTVAQQLEEYAEQFARWDSVVLRPPPAERNVAIAAFMPCYRMALEILTKGPLG